MNLCVILLTYNESANINACLDSLAGLDAGIFAVDSFSTDNTVDLLEKRGIAYVQHPFENYARQRNWAQENCPFPAAWVLHLDAGERLSPELTDWLRHHFDPNTPASGYLFSRRTIFMDRWIRHGGHYPNYHLRLFRRDRGHCEAKAYDQHFLCGGLVLKAPWKADLIDIVSSNLVDFTNSHTRWALLEAVERISQPHDTGEVTPRFWGTPIERRRWWKTGLFDRSPLFARAFLYFIYRYVIRFGFLDGFPGLIFHFLQGCWFRFLVDALVLDIRRSQVRTGQSLNQTLCAIYGQKNAKQPI